MSGIFLALLFLLDDAAVRKTIATFNHTWERRTVLTRGATISDFPDCWAPGQSQMYFEVTSVRFPRGGTALVEANGNRYGSLILKRTTPATFVLKLEGADWKIDALRVSENCLGSIWIRQ